MHGVEARHADDERRKADGAGERGGLDGAVDAAGGGEGGGAVRDRDRVKDGGRAQRKGRNERAGRGRVVGRGDKEEVDEAVVADGGFGEAAELGGERAVDRVRLGKK